MKASTPPHELPAEGDWHMAPGSRDGSGPENGAPPPDTGQVPDAEHEPGIQRTLPTGQTPVDRLHLPVFAGRVSSLLGPAFTDAERPVFVDATLGMGGHTLLLLAAHPTLRVIGIDRDPTALRIAGDRITAAGYADRVDLVHAVYDEVGQVIGRRSRGGVQGILFDLGV